MGSRSSAARTTSRASGATTRSGSRLGAQGDERAPLVFALGVPPRDRLRPPLALRELVVHAPVAPALPASDGPLVRHVPGPHRLEVVLGEGPLLEISDVLAIRAPGP